MLNVCWMLVSWNVQICMSIFVEGPLSFAISNFLLYSSRIISTSKSLFLVWTSVGQPHANIYATVSTNQHIKPSIYSFLPKCLVLASCYNWCFAVSSTSMGWNGMKSRLKKHLSGGVTNLQKVVCDITKDFVFVIYILKMQSQKVHLNFLL